MPIAPFKHETSCLKYTKFCYFEKKTALKIKVHIIGKMYEGKYTIFGNGFFQQNRVTRKRLESSSSISYSFILWWFVSSSLPLRSENFTHLLASFACSHTAFLYFHWGCHGASCEMSFSVVLLCLNFRSYCDVVGLDSFSFSTWYFSGGYALTF